MGLEPERSRDVALGHDAMEIRNLSVGGEKETEFQSPACCEGHG